MTFLRQASAIQASRSPSQTQHDLATGCRRHGVRHRVGIVLKLLMMIAVVAGVVVERRANAVGTTAIIVMEGDPVPDGSGLVLKFGFNTQPILNSAGQVAFFSEIFETGVGVVGGGLFLGDGSTLTQFAGNGGPIALNDVGELAFFTGNTTTGIDLLRATDTTQTQIAFSGQALTDGSGSINIRIFSPSLSDGIFAFNNAGQVAFRPDILVDGTPNDDTAVFRGDGGALTQIARAGQAAPDGNGSLAGIFRQVSLNEAGQVAFLSILTDTSGSISIGTGVFRGDGSTLTQIVREGQVLPDGSGNFGRFFNNTTHNFTTPINDAGQVAFIADVGSLTPGDAGIFVGDGSTLTQIVRAGEAAPDGDGQFSLSGSFFWSVLNNAGQVAITARIQNSNGSFSDGIFRGDGETLIQIAREGQVAPDGIGVFSGIGGTPAINDPGQVAFSAELFGGGSRGVFFYDDTLGLLQIARLGDAFLGSTITGLDSIAASPSGEEFTGLNNLGQVAFSFSLADGRDGIALWSIPEPGAASLVLLGFGGAILRRGCRS